MLKTIMRLPLSAGAIILNKEVFFMNHLNSIILEGNVVRQAELREPAPGFLVCKFPVATNRYYKDSSGNGKEEVSFVDVEVYGKYGEFAEKKCVKGRGVRVVGRIKQDRWESEDGKKNNRIFIVAEHLEYKPKPGEPAVVEEEMEAEAANF